MREDDNPIKSTGSRRHGHHDSDDDAITAGAAGRLLEDRDDEDDDDDDDDDDGDDLFRSAFLSGRGRGDLSRTVQALTGMMTGSGTASRLREILESLKAKDDPSRQLIALNELSQLLLVSTEDNLSGHFAPDQFVKELVALMQPNEFGEENSEIMLVACRCIANLMEALPPATPSVVFGGAVPVLCQKLLEINYIDLAEQAISVNMRHPLLSVHDPLTSVPDSRKDIRRIRTYHRARRRLDCLPDLPRLLRH
jgi:E3 ubiquitin-protein ligase TRIP12